MAFEVVDFKEVLAMARARSLTLDDNHPPREDSCSCFKPGGCYGAHGWHWEVIDTRSPQGDAAYERCDRYWAKANRWDNEEERGAPESIQGGAPW